MYPTANLQPGQRGSQVSQLQQFLLSQGYLTSDQIASGPGVYGPQTTAAVAKWQQDKGVDNTSGPGYWGPRSISAASGVSSGGGPGTPNESTPTQESVDQEYAAAAAGNPVIQELANGGSSVEDIMSALQTGNLTGIVDWNGQPFSAADQQDALAKATEDNKLYYEALKNKETADAEASMASDQAAYQEYLVNSGQQFEADKTASDQKAADSGILFSGARAQKQKNLKRAYEQDQASTLNKVGASIRNKARDYQYKYGNNAAQSLSNSYKLGTNTFNPNVARGGVGSGGISSAYNPSGQNFQGTRNVERSTAANQRAAGYLKNKGNKLLSTGYNNQL